MEPERVELTKQPSGHAFTREQKVGYALVIACGVLAVVLGVFYLVQHLHRPFVVSYNGSRVWTSEEQEAREVAEQRRSDTDEDGVSDYDELYIYKSSPYLSDTDSDGIADDVEIMNGGDPNCAVGAACEDETNETRDIDEAFEDDVDEAAVAAQQAAEQFTQIQEMLKNLSVGEIRSILIESGADRTQIEAMTDDEIKALYEQVLAELEKSGGLEEMTTQFSQLQ